MPTGRRRGLRFGLLGFPVEVDLSFLIVLAFLGYAALSRGLAFLAAWVVIAAVSVLVHELGHAVAARAAGAHPHISLVGFGGLTTFEQPTGGLSRARSIGISLAGPATGLVLGGGLLLLRRSADLDPFSLGAYALYAGVFVTLGWGLLNLLPILPLDGGNVLVELLPGPPARRIRLAAVVSIACALGAAVVALLTGQVYAALLAGWLAVGNVAAVRAPRPALQTGAPPATAPPASAPPATAPLSPEQLGRRAQDSRAVLWLIDQDRPAQARHLADTAPAGIDPSVVGVLLVALGDVERGTEVVVRACADAPQDPLRQQCLQRLQPRG